jgi:putative glutamine amidotransferase
MKPRILLTTRPSNDAAPIDESPFREYVYQSYIDALRSQGAIVSIMPISDPEDIPTLLHAVDAVVVCGGRDINPKLYGQEVGFRTQDPNDRLDSSDLGILQTAKEMLIPTLGICRGMQMLNVFQGGTLNQDISGERADHPLMPETFEERAAQRHEVDLISDSWLGKTFQQEKITTNSIHHQCIEQLGEELKVVGRASDGTIEAIESTSEWFAIGVQWHPELFGDPSIIFGNFIDEVIAHRVSHNRREI